MGTLLIIQSHLRTARQPRGKVRHVPIVWLVLRRFVGCGYRFTTDECGLHTSGSRGVRQYLVVRRMLKPVGARP